MKNKSIILQNLSKIVVAVISFAVAYIGMQYLFSGEKLEKKLQKITTELNKLTPKLIDDFTRIDSVSSKGEESITYHYTLVNLQKQDIQVDTVNKYLKFQIIEKVKTQSELKFFRDNDILMNYKYYDKNGEFVTEISVTPDLLN